MPRARALRLRGAPAFVLLAGATLVVASLVLLIPGKQRLSPNPFAPCLQASTFDIQARCMEPHLREFAQTGRTKEALDSFETRFREGSLDDCHMPAHHLGHHAYVAQRDLAAAFLAGDARCGGGYYHGVVEAALMPAPTEHPHGGNLEPGGLCARFELDPKAYDGCVHGLGHGLMQQAHHDVPAALMRCGELVGAPWRHRCEAGVFMENSVRYLDRPDVEYRAQAPKACDGLALSEERSLLCASQVGEAAMFYYRHNLKSALALCEPVADVNLREACRRGAEGEAVAIAEERASLRRAR